MIGTAARPDLSSASDIRRLRNGEPCTATRQPQFGSSLPRWRSLFTNEIVCCRGKLTGGPHYIYLPGDFKLPLVLRWADMLPGATHLTHCCRAPRVLPKYRAHPAGRVSIPLTYGFVVMFAASGVMRLRRTVDVVSDRGARVRVGGGN